MALAMVDIAASEMDFSLHRHPHAAAAEMAPSYFLLLRAVPGIVFVIFSRSRKYYHRDGGAVMKSMVVV